MSVSLLCFLVFFFFQAEDGIRDLTVTGVQTCALPISSRARSCGSRRSAGSVSWVDGRRSTRGVLPVELPQLPVECGMLALELDRFLEERLRRDGEELGRIGRPVPVQRPLSIMFGVPAQPLVLLRQHAAPGGRDRDLHLFREGESTASLEVFFEWDTVFHDVVPGVRDRTGRQPERRRRNAAQHGGHADVSDDNREIDHETLATGYGARGGEGSAGGSTRPRALSNFPSWGAASGGPPRTKAKRRPRHGAPLAVAADISVE